MFKWLTNIVDHARIAVAYLGYERECKKQWVADVERNFSTTHVEQEIKARMLEPLSHVASTFNAPISELEARRANVRRVVPVAEVETDRQECRATGLLSVTCRSWNPLILCPNVSSWPITDGANQAWNDRYRQHYRRQTKWPNGFLCSDVSTRYCTKQSNCLQTPIL